MVRSRLLRFLALLMVLIAPPTMMASHTASAAPTLRATEMSAAMPGHCQTGDSDSDTQKTAADIDCMILCSAIPAEPGEFAGQVVFRPAELSESVETTHGGLTPLFDPPPPRPI